VCVPALMVVGKASLLRGRVEVLPPWIATIAGVGPEARERVVPSTVIGEPPGTSVWPPETY
jgi:hypothetical protein